MQRYWRITGYAGLDQIFERIVPRHCLADAEVRLLLQCLIAREIDVDRLIDSFGVAGTLEENAVLGVEYRAGPYPSYSIRSADVSFEATVMTEACPRASLVLRSGRHIAA